MAMLRLLSWKVPIYRVIAAFKFVAQPNKTGGINRH
jgi:hypothetical protein